MKKFNLNGYVSHRLDAYLGAPLPLGTMRDYLTQIIFKTYKGGLVYPLFVSGFRKIEIISIGKPLVYDKKKRAWVEVDEGFDKTGE